MDYFSLARMASAMGYTEFTQLQKEAFQNPEILRPDQNILVMGPTSSGKTLIPMLMYYQRVQEADRERKPRPKMLFVVPYKALASQKCTELVAPYQEVYGADSPLRAVQSTGEYRYADRAIQQADVDVAVIISEKAFLFSCENHAFLSQFDEVVFDEIGLLADESRGVKLDFLLVWCRMMQRQYGRPRMTLLATPLTTGLPTWKSLILHWWKHLVAPVCWNGRFLCLAARKKTWHIPVRGTLTPRCRP